jgi:hypothetical protein
MKLIGVEIPERFVFRAGVTCTRAALAGRNVFRLLGVRPLPGGQGSAADGQRAGLEQPSAGENAVKLNSPGGPPVSLSDMEISFAAREEPSVSPSVPCDVAKQG